MLTLTSPVEIWAHRWPASVKLALLSGWTVFLFWLTSPLSLALAMLAVAALVASGGHRFAGDAARMLRPLWLFVVVVAVWHGISADYAAGAAILMRMISAVAAANFVTMTTRLSQMIQVFEWLARPFAALGLPPRRLALAVALVVRFIPTMLDRMGQIADAWKARSPRRPGWRILVPATLAAIDDADHAAEALRARGGVD